MATSSTAVGANEKPTAFELIKPLVKALSITVGIETPRCVLVPATVVNVNSDAKAFGLTVRQSSWAKTKDTVEASEALRETGGGEGLLRNGQTTNGECVNDLIATEKARAICDFLRIAVTIRMDSCVDLQLHSNHSR